MKPEISELLSISGFFGRNKEYGTAGGGPISFKDNETIWVKATGIPPGGINEDDLVALNREKLGLISALTYSDDVNSREEEVETEIFNAILDPGRGKRPNGETLLHNLINYRFVLHLQPTLLNGLLCSRNARNLTVQLFGEKVLFIPYADPGYNLFKRLDSEIVKFREKFMSDPQIIFLENQGSIFSADTTEEIRRKFDEVVGRIIEVIDPLIEPSQLPYNPDLNRVLPAVRMLLSGDYPKVIRYRHNSLIASYYKSQQEFQKISHPLTPDTVFNCRYRYIYVEQTQSPERILESLRGQFERFSKEYKKRLGYTRTLFISSECLEGWIVPACRKLSVTVPGSIQVR